MALGWERRMPALAPPAPTPGLRVGLRGPGSSPGRRGASSRWKPTVSFSSPLSERPLSMQMRLLAQEDREKANGKEQRQRFAHSPSQE